MNALLKYALRTVVAALLLTAVSFFSLLLLAGFQDFPALQVTGGIFLLRVLLSRLLIAAVLVRAAVRSRWAGTQLMFVVFLTYFGIYTFIPHFEALFALSQHVSAGTAALLSAHGFLEALLFSLCVVAVSGRMAESVPVRESSRLHMPTRQWLARLAACLLVRLMLKGCGAASVWLVSGGAPARMNVERVVGWAALQTGQALLLLFFSLPVIKMMKGRPAETALTVAALLCVLAAVAPVIMVDPFLPGAVSGVRTLEMAVSNFLYGALVGGLFSYGVQPAEPPV